VSDAFFTPIGDGRFQGEEACTGPWSAAHMHGGRPSALLVRACEQAADEAPAGLVALRASIDFLSAVPVGPVEVSARVVRGGRRITLTESVMTAGGRDVLHAKVWHVRAADAQTPVLDQQPPAAVPPPDQTEATLQGWRFGYARAMEWRVVGGDPVGPGPATVWTRARIPVVPGEEPSGLQRAVLSADSGNGISANLDWSAWSFVNIDLDVHLSRPLIGAWVLLDAATRYEAGGTGLAASSLWDERGRVGRGAQTLVVSPQQA
jgi:Thioesterase-like superfamily